VRLRRRQLPEDLEALVRELDAGLAGDRLEVLEPILEQVVGLVAHLFLSRNYS